MANRDPLETVRGLLAKAQASGTTPAEAQALTAKAAQFMAKYGIDMAMLAATEPKRDVMTDDTWLTMEAPFAQSKAQLLGVVARAYRLTAIQHQETTRRGSRRAIQYRMHLIGFESDVLRTQVMFTSLVLQATNEMLAIKTPTDANGKWEYDQIAFRDSFLANYASAISTRLRGAEREAAEQYDRTASSGTPGTALVLADRKQLVDKRVADLYPHLRTINRKVNGLGRTAGWAAGMRADLGENHVGRGRTAEIR